MPKSLEDLLKSGGVKSYHGVVRNRVGGQRINDRFGRITPRIAPYLIPDLKSRKRMKGGRVGIKDALAVLAGPAGWAYLIANNIKEKKNEKLKAEEAAKAEKEKKEAEEKQQAIQQAQQAAIDEHYAKIDPEWWNKKTQIEESAKKAAEKIMAERDKQKQLEDLLKTQTDGTLNDFNVDDDDDDMALDLTDLEPPKKKTKAKKSGKKSGKGKGKKGKKKGKSSTNVSDLNDYEDDDDLQNLDLGSLF